MDSLVFMLSLFWWEVDMGRMTLVMNSFQYSQYHQESSRGRAEKRNQHNQKTDEMLLKSCKKKKKQLKLELIIWECIDVRFAPLLLLNGTEELSDETPDFRKATISLKWKVTQNDSRCWAAVLTNQGVIVPKFHQCHLICKFSTWAWPPISPVVLKALCWPPCVLLYLISFFFLGCEIQLNPYFTAEQSGK